MTDEHGFENNFGNNPAPSRHMKWKHDRDKLRGVLQQHWLTGIHCDHESKTDVATCFCTVWRSDPMPNVGAAVNAWIDHVFEQLP
jgi:hypothetical protein